jgi:Zn-dependent protease with chaperone function
VLDSDAVCAFSHPGGYIYVCRGLFELVGEDVEEGEDYALEFVLGHEIAHVDLKHALACLQDPDLKNSGLGTLPQFYSFIFPLGYLYEQEVEADRWAFERLRHGDRRTRRESLAFLRSFERHAKAHGFGAGRDHLLGKDLSPVENHYRAHPAAQKRLNALTSLAPAAAPVPK